MLPSLVTFGGAIVLMIYIDRKIGLLTVVLVPLCFLLMKRLRHRIRGLAHQLAGEYAMAMAIAEDQIRLLPVIKPLPMRHRHQPGTAPNSDVWLTLPCARSACGRVWDRSPNA